MCSHARCTLPLSVRAAIRLSAARRQDPKPITHCAWRLRPNLSVNSAEAFPRRLMGGRTCGGALLGRYMPTMTKEQAFAKHPLADARSEL